MIHQQSSSAQFVTTTFRAELLKDADRHFGVFYRGKASQVDLHQWRLEGGIWNCVFYAIKTHCELVR